MPENHRRSTTPTLRPLSDYVAESLKLGLLVPTPAADIFWTPSIDRKLNAASQLNSADVQLRYTDFMVGTYRSLEKLKAELRRERKHYFAFTEIHHIVEHYHLQFIARAGMLTEQTYYESEPCVVLTDRHHELYLESLLGGAEAVVLEAKPFNFIQQFRAANPQISKLSKTQQARRRAEWVDSQATRKERPVSRRQIRAWIHELYDFAYQQADEQVLRLIAHAVIRSVPA